MRIAATLELPAATPGKRWPAVVLAVGAGKWGRGWYVALRSRLHAAGVATLSYDKRGFGESTGAFDESLPFGLARHRGGRELPAVAGRHRWPAHCVARPQPRRGRPTAGGRHRRRHRRIVMLQAPSGHGRGLWRRHAEVADAVRHAGRHGASIVAATLAWLEARTQRLPAPRSTACARLPSPRLWRLACHRRAPGALSKAWTTRWCCRCTTRRWRKT